MSLTRLIRETKDLFECIIIPGLAAFLPWRFCFKLFRWLSRYHFLYRQEADAAFTMAQRYGYAENPDHWRANYRLVQLVDKADLFLSVCRSDRWLKHNVKVVGDRWPQTSDPVLAVTFHWGAGLWSLRYFRTLKKRTAFLSRRFDQQTLADRLCCYVIAKARLQEVRRLGRAQIIFRGGSVKKILAALNNDINVVALLDVPIEAGRSSLIIDLLGKKALIPRGLIRLAVQDRIPVMVYTMGLDQNTGKRELRIKGPLPNHTEHLLAKSLSSMLNDAIKQDSSAWHFWHLVEQFILK